MRKLSSAERLLRTVRGEPVDRVPILSPLDWTPLSPDPAAGSWRDEPNYHSLIPFVTYLTGPAPQYTMVALRI